MLQDLQTIWQNKQTGSANFRLLETSFEKKLGADLHTLGDIVNFSHRTPVQLRKLPLIFRVYETRVQTKVGAIVHAHFVVQCDEQRL